MNPTKEEKKKNLVGEYKWRYIIETDWWYRAYDNFISPKIQSRNYDRKYDCEKWIDEEERSTFTKIYFW